jgi:AraC-like DNA-binding protein
MQLALLAPMLLVVRHAVHGPGGQTEWRQEELRSRDLVFVRSRYLGAHRDEAFAAEFAEGCASIRFVLGGPLVASVGGKPTDVREGDLLGVATHGTSRARTLEPGSDVLFVGWRVGSSVGDAMPRDVHLGASPAAAASLRRLASLLADRDAPEPSLERAASDAIGALRAEGFPLGADAPLAAQADARRLAMAMETSLGGFASQPTALDLSRALGVGEHHALRRANEWFRRFYFGVSGWREYLRRRRLDLGAFFMGRPDARTEDVARALGFRSPTSFCHAFHEARLPSPRAVQSALLGGALGRARAG